MAGPGHIEIVLNGAFRVLHETRQDITPTSRKAQAVLALLATSDSLKRTRAFLQDTVWSASDATRGAASLRQALMAIRKSLGDDADALIATNQSVQLNADSFKVRWNKTPSEDESEFLEGIDIRDPEFNDWLRLIRGKNKPQPHNPTSYAEQAGARWRLVIQTAGQQPSKYPLLEAQFANVVSKNLAESLIIDLASDLPSDPDPNLFLVKVEILPIDGKQVAFRINASCPARNRNFWSEVAVCSDTLDENVRNLELLSLAFRLQTSVLKEISIHSGGNSQLVLPQAKLGGVIQQIFSFQPDRIRAAEKLLIESFEPQTAANFLGWQAQIAIIDLIEQFSDSPEACIERGKEFAAKAMEADSMNSMVLSTAANAQVLLDWDMEAGVALSKLAIKINPANPMGWWASSNVSLYTDQPEQALEAAQVASRLAAKTPLQFWCDFQVGLAAMRLGQYDLAIRSLETAAALSPSFRPPRRYLLAIYIHLKRFDRATQMVAQLKKLEPDFSLDRLLNDDDYPISLARKQQLLVPSDVKELIYLDRA